MKLVAAICGVQSEQFLEKTLESLAKTDIDAIHYMDGSWDNTGINLPQSTDKTRAILSRFKENSSIEVNYDFSPEGWKTQSQKRNAQLYDIQDRFGPDTWILVIDDDEVLESIMNMSLDFKSLLADKIYSVGTIESVAPPPGEALADLQVMKTPRFIKLAVGIHYHTETNMHVHDIDCETICDYHNERDGVVTSQVWNFPGVIVKNYWMQRSNERLEHKNQYYTYLTKSNKSIGECKYE